MSLILKIAIAVAICLTVGFTSALFTADSINSWYVDLNKPFFNPPNWLFAPAWTVLYIMMGVAVGLVWDRGLNHPAVKTALGIFAVQLVLNALWSLIFFGAQRPEFALIEILILWATIFICIKQFQAIRPLAALLMVPYILWVSFATILNLSVWYLS